MSYDCAVSFSKDRCVIASIVILVTATMIIFVPHYFDIDLSSEGHVGHYEKLIVNRPNAININAALSSEAKTYHYLHHMKPSPVDGILEFMEEKFIKKCHKM